MFISGWHLFPSAFKDFREQTAPADVLHLFSRTYLDSWFSTGRGKDKDIYPWSSFLLFHNKLPQTEWPKKKTYLLAHSSVNQKSGYSVAGLSAQAQVWLKSRCQLGLSFLIWSLGSSPHPIQVISRIHTLQPEDWGPHFLTISRELLWFLEATLPCLDPNGSTVSMFAFFFS